MSFYHISYKSNNKKTGSIAVVTSSRDTCPTSCPFKEKGCYAKSSLLRFHWNKVSDGRVGKDFNGFIKEINKMQILKNKTLEIEKLIKNRELSKQSKSALYKDLKKSAGVSVVRLFQAGDLPGIGDRINFTQVKKLVKSLYGLYVFGYTHKPLSIKQNKEAIKYCNNNNVVINVSANNLIHADELCDKNVGPVVVTLPRNFKGKVTFTPKGRKVKVCPAILNNNITCSACGGKNKSLCGNINRDFIIGFPAHGAGAKRVSEVYENYENRC